MNPALDDNTWIVVPFDNLSKTEDAEWLRGASVNLLYLDMSRWRVLRIIGITFALLTWLIVVCLCVVVAAVISAEIGGAPTIEHRPVIPDNPVGPPSRESAVRSGGSLGGDEDVADPRQPT